MSKKELRDYSIGQPLTVQLQIVESMHNRIGQSAIAQLELLDKKLNTIVQTLSAQLQVGLPNRVSLSKYQLNVPSKERMTEFLRKENEGLYNKEEKE